MNHLYFGLIFLISLVSVGCESGAVDDQQDEQQSEDSLVTDTALDQQLRALVADQNITGDPTTGLDIPSIHDPLSQLGMKLFFSKSLGGEMDSACVTCHHPALGGTDNLSLGVGVEAIDIDVLGAGRRSIDGGFHVPRNAPTTFNSALYRESLFWDSRISQLDNGIRTPDTSVNTADSNAGDSLLTAQAKFPVTSVEEMKTERFETGSSNEAVRGHLAARIGGYNGGFDAANELSANNWSAEFQTAYGSSESPESLVNYNNIAKALASYEASQIFINNPWKNYIDGNNEAISDQAKQGAVLFFTSRENGGGDCSRCHSGDLFSDESHHVVAFPQIGPGKGDGPTSDDDFGLERETGNTNDRYKFRTPSLLNSSMTAPYGHAGAYQTLREVIRHYDQPGRALDLFQDNNWCNMISDNANENSCNTAFPNARTNTQRAQNALDEQPRDDSINGINLNNNEVDALIAFLETLTDPCIQDRSCLAPWIPPANGGPDGNQLNARDQFGNAL